MPFVPWNEEGAALAQKARMTFARTAVIGTRILKTWKGVVSDECEVCCYQRQSGRKFQFGRMMKKVVKEVVKEIVG